MFISRDPEATTRKKNDRKELKVRLPVDLHLQLHHLKIVTGRTISSTVTEALALYYEEVGYGSSRASEASSHTSQQTAEGRA